MMFGISPRQWNNLKALMLATGFVVFMTLVLSLVVGCRIPPPTTTIGKVIQCSAEGVRSNWPKAIGPVNQCLANTDDTRACLIALINPAVGITEDVIACLVKDRGAAFLEAAESNPDDRRSGRAASRAERYLRDMDYRFAE